MDERNIPDDRELVQGLKARSFATFEQLVARYEHSLINYCFWKCRDRTRAEQYFQKVVVELALKAGELDERQQLKVQIYQVARSVLSHPLDGKEEPAQVRSVLVTGKRTRFSEVAALPSAESERMWKFLHGQVAPDLREVAYLRLFGELDLEETVKVVGGNPAKWRYALRRMLEQVAAFKEKKGDAA